MGLKYECDGCGVVINSHAALDIEIRWNHVPSNLVEIKSLEKIASVLCNGCLKFLRKPAHEWPRQDKVRGKK